MAEETGSDLSKCDSKPATANERETQQNPIPRNSSQSTQPNANGNCRYSGGNYYLEGLTALLALIAAVASAFSAIYSGQQASIARAQLSLADGTAKLQLRSYILFESGNIAIDGSKYAASVTIKNGGQTPAYSVRCWFGTVVKDSNEIRPDVLQCPPDRKGKNSTDIGSQQPLVLDSNRCIALPSESAGTVPATTKTIYALGLILYDDVFGTHHLERFVAMSRSNRGALGVVLNDTDATGNDCF